MLAFLTFQLLFKQIIETLKTHRLNLLSVLDFVCISNTLLLGDLQNFRLLTLLGGSALHLTLKFEFYLRFSQKFSKNDFLAQALFRGCTKLFQCHDFCSLSKSRT